MKIVYLMLPILLVAVFIGTTASIAQAAVDLNNSPVQVASTSISPASVFSAQFVNSASSSATVLVDLELYNSSGTKVGQTFFESQTFGAGETRSFSLANPPNLPDGTYTVDIGIFRPNWTETLYWASNVAQLVLPASSTPTTTPDLTLQAAAQTSTTVPSGGSNTLHATFVNNDGGLVRLFDLELYDQNGQKVAQNFFDNVSVGHGAQYFADLTASGLQPGSYQWKAGIFTPGWSSLIQWYDNVASFTVSSGTTTPPQTGGQHNGNISVVDVQTPKQPLVHGQTPYPNLDVRLISGGGENANNVSVHLQLLTGSSTVRAEQVYSGQNILHEQPMSYTLQLPNDLEIGTYAFKLVVLNQDGSLNVTFPLSTISVQ